MKSRCASVLLAALPAALLLGASPMPAHAAAPAPLPGDSVLQLPGEFTDQSAQRFTLAARRGHPQLVGMFYASCQSV